MSRRFTLVTVVLTAVVSLLIGVIVAGGLGRPMVSARNAASAEGVTASPAAAVLPAGSLVNFADVVERINPAVVNIEATSRGERRRNRPATPPGRPDIFGGPGDTPPQNDNPRR